jgi:Family of unknown function (DUF6510)
MDQQEEVGLPLDGNAAAGVLRELFAFDMTAAEVTCGSCGTVTMVGETKLYGGVMGAIFRCPHCCSHHAISPYAFWDLVRHAGLSVFICQMGAIGARCAGPVCISFKCRHTIRSQDLPRIRRGRRECRRSHQPPRCASHISPSCSRAAARP